MLEVKDLSFSYGDRLILSDISLKAEKGDFVSVLGSNGAGKSTLFKCILGILSGYSGTVSVDGQDTRTMSVREIARKIAYIPQMSASAFNYSVQDIVLMGTTVGLRALGSPGREEMARVEEAMERMGISHLRRRCFHHLSGGEKQLTVIARALAQQADILLLDEPCSALDFGNRFRILNVAKSLAVDGYLVIQTTHDPEGAYIFSDRIMALRSGTVFAQGTPEEVLTSENIRELYGVSTKQSSIFDDRVRVFTPDAIL
ncbi:MAG: ABC transporter ATP-binding protein [Eubacteriales bacterium]|nr:ABC transporter ATP-binding protein [Eubacteriales bacterium]